jgi:hypothetical protein
VSADAEPTPERFWALARSSPWLWSTVEFERTTRGDRTLRAWVRQPDEVRVGDQINRADGPRAGYRWPRQSRPAVHAGLVTRRPSEWEVDYDGLFYQDYHWVAMLDPAELADGRDADAGVGVELDRIRLVEHHGRAAWQALAAPTVRYDPRCTCCALLDGEFDFDAQQWVPGSPSLVRLDRQTGVCVYVAHRGGSRAGVDLDVRVIAVDGPPPAEQVG